MIVFSELMGLLINKDWADTMGTLGLTLEGVLLPLVGVFGVFGNLASVVVLNSSSVDMKISFCRILTMLAIYDTFLILGSIGVFGLRHISSFYSDSIFPYVIPYLLPICQIALSGSTWATVSVAMERFTSIVIPHHKLCRVPILIFILPVVILSIFWNIPRFFELLTCIRDVKTPSIVNGKHVILRYNQTSVCPTDLRKNPNYVLYYTTVASTILMIFIPLLLLCVLNACIYATIKRISKKCHRLGKVSTAVNSRDKRDQKIAMLLITVVVVFLVCNIPRVIVNTYEVFHLAIYGDADQHWPDWIQLLTHISNFLLVFNSSINIFIYCWKDAKFRLVLSRMLKIQGPPTLNNRESVTMMSFLESKRNPEKSVDVVKATEDQDKKLNCGGRFYKISRV